MMSPPSSSRTLGPRLGEVEDLLGLVPVLGQRLALPGEDGRAPGRVDGAVTTDDDRGGRVVLGGEDVAGGPAHVGTEVHEGLDEDGGLDRHVQRAGDAGAREGLLRAVALAHGHQAGHLVLGELDLLAAVLGQAEVGDLEVHRLSPEVCGACLRRTSVHRRDLPRGPQKRRTGLTDSENPRRGPGVARRAPRDGSSGCSSEPCPPPMPKTCRTASTSAPTSRPTTAESEGVDQPPGEAAERLRRSRRGRPPPSGGRRRTARAGRRRARCPRGGRRCRRSRRG